MQYHIQPSKARIIPAQKEDLETIDALQAPKTAVIYLDESECTDYIVDRNTGNLYAPLKTIAINGVPYYLQPGKNEVPPAVFEFWENAKQQQQEAIEKNTARNLDNVYARTQGRFLEAPEKYVDQSALLKLEDAKARWIEEKAKAATLAVSPEKE